MQDRYAYYPGCLASLSQKELDSSTRAIWGSSASSWSRCRPSRAAARATSTRRSPTTTCTSRRASSARPSAPAVDTILTICNVCTLNLRQANKRLQEDPAELARDQRQPRGRSASAATRAASTCGTCCGRSRRATGYERFKQVAVQVARGAQGGAVLRLPDPAARQAARLRGSRSPRVAGAPDRGLRRRGDRLPGEDQVLRLPDRAGARGRGAGRARPAARSRPPTPAPT